MKFWKKKGAQFEDFVANGVLTTTEATDFECVLDERMKCDYSLYVFKQSDAQDCLNRAEKFLEKIETITV